MEIYKKYKTGELYCGDCRVVLKSLPAKCIDTVVTSPPYWGLRDYGIEPTIWGGDEGCVHQWENKERWLHRGSTKSELPKHQITDAKITDNTCTICSAWRGTLGLEPHPSMFITHLVEIFREIRRVLKDTGAVWLNLGDTYFSTSGNNSDYAYATGDQRTETIKRRHYKRETDKSNWLQPKQLMLMPHRVAIALQDDGWIIRNDCVWYKRNPMPSSVKDRFNVTKEYMFFMVMISAIVHADLLS